MHIWASQRARVGPAIVTEVPMNGSRSPRVTWTGTSRRPPPRFQYGFSTRYGCVGARRTFGVSTIDRLSRPRSLMSPIAAVFADQYAGHGNTDASYAMS